MTTRARAPSVAECKAMGMSCLCFQLRKAARAVTQHFDTIFAPAGLKATQFTLLSAISVMQPVSIGALAEWTVSDASTLSRNLDLLERRGLLRSTEGPDRRVRSIRLSATGRRALARAYPLWIQAQEGIAAELGSVEVRGTLAALGRITSRTRAVTGTPAARRRRARQGGTRRATAIA